MEAKRILMSLLSLLITAKVTCEDCMVLRRKDKLKIYLKDVKTAYHITFFQRT